MPVISIHSQGKPVFTMQTVMKTNGLCSLSLHLLLYYNFKLLVFSVIHYWHYISQYSVDFLYNFKSNSMIKNYFKTAFRVFGRHKLFTIINIIGLSIGISAALVIYFISAFDFSFDKFHPNSERIYRVVTNFTRSGEPGATGGVIAALPDAAQTEVAGLLQSAPFYRFDQLNVAVPNGSASSTKFKNQDNVVITDNRYFKLFSYKWLAGSPATALNAPNQVVLTSNQAKIYFPHLTTDQIIGREVIYDDSIRTAVSGIVQAFKRTYRF